MKAVPFIPVAVLFLGLLQVARETPRDRMGDLSRQQYLQRQPIQESLTSGDFSRLQSICSNKVSVNLGSPLLLQGYFGKKQFTRDFSRGFSRFSLENIEWGSMQVEENLAVQSLNIVLMDRVSRKRTSYKLILFMVKEKEWNLYYLRGLKL